jgi:deazaflavin-dependent oxidoreductase (nitroreductase family)
VLDPRAAELDFCYVTTIGRVTGLEQTIEIWFAVSDNTIYILAGGGHGSGWVKNVKRHASAPVRIGERVYEGTARIVEDAAEDATARRLLLEKYGPRYSGDLDEWGRSALPVAIELS